MTKKPDYQRLARYVLDRRKQLGLGQDEVKALSGPSTATMRSIEHGDPISRQIGTTFPLERIFGWRPGSVHAILRGEEPGVYADPDYSYLRRSLPAHTDEAQAWPAGGSRPELVVVSSSATLASRLPPGVDRLTERQVEAILSVVQAMLPAQETEVAPRREPGKKAAAREGANNGGKQG